MSEPARIGLLHTRIRVEERMLLDAFAAREIEVELLDARELVIDPCDRSWAERFDVVVDRCVSLTASLTVGRTLETLGVRCMNAPETVELCSDKLRTSAGFGRAGIPSPAVRISVGEEAALRAVEEIGYPAVIKPTVGSWGRLVSRVNDRDAAEAIIEHRFTLGSAAQHVFYVQEHIEKPGRDLRLFVVGGETIAGIARRADHWVTNTARGAVAEGIEVTAEMASICNAASACVGADICAVDLLECPRRGLMVNEVNHSLEFRNSVETTGVDIPGRFVDHVLQIARATTGGCAGATA